MTTDQLTRRSFLKVLGLGTGALLVAPELLIHLQPPPHLKLNALIQLSNELIRDAPGIVDQIALTQLERMEEIERRQGRLHYQGTWQLVGENPQSGQRERGRAANGRFTSTGRWTQTWRRYVLVPTP